MPGAIHPEVAEAISELREHLPARSRPIHYDGTEEVTCPVCLGSLQFGLETNCAHLFCGEYLQ